MTAPNNRSIRLAADEQSKLAQRLLRTTSGQPQLLITDCCNRTIHGSLESVAPLLPADSVDLLVADPPYNINKRFRSSQFKAMSGDAYTAFTRTWLEALLPCLKADASVYIFGDWRSSTAIAAACAGLLTVRNRITWEREKGRGSKRNWKNCSEDIWFCTVSNKEKDYYFDADSVRLKRRVLAPYRSNGKPKDWQDSQAGKFRMTAPSNLLTDLTVPFWSMPENTEHPTQKPEKLIAKLILASCPLDGVVLDPFLGSGTTSVTAAKLGRRYIGVEQDETYCCLAEKRLEMAAADNSIQGYTDGVFWERNSQPRERRK